MAELNPMLMAAFFLVTVASVSHIMGILQPYWKILAIPNMDFMGLWEFCTSKGCTRYEKSTDRLVFARVFAFTSAGFACLACLVIGMLITLGFIGRVQSPGYFFLTALCNILSTVSAVITLRLWKPITHDYMGTYLLPNAAAAREPIHLMDSAGYSGFLFICGAVFQSIAALLLIFQGVLKFTSSSKDKRQTDNEKKDKI